MRATKLKCAMCGGNNPKYGAGCLDVFVCSDCLDAHPDKTANELLMPFLAKYFDEDGELKRMHMH
jgi:hypothetical protein